MKFRSLINNKRLLIDEIFAVQFLSSENNFKTNDELSLSSSLVLSISSQNESIKFNFTNSNPSSNSTIIKIDYDMIIEFNEKYIIFSKYEKMFWLSSENIIFEIDNEGLITVRIGADSSSIIFDYYENKKIKNLSYVANVTTILEYERIPEFSIATFDDNSFTIPRPIRQGVPIISTVPSLVNNSSSSSDISTFTLGKGLNKKTIHFRIICNKVMESLSSNDLSEMKLKIYLPNGLDTVKSATYVNMYFVSNDTTNDISIYRASYDFYSQGTFDGIEYVDGYTNFDVHVPLTIQRSMPFEFDFVLL